MRGIQSHYQHQHFSCVCCIYGKFRNCLDFVNNRLCICVASLNIRCTSNVYNLLRPCKANVSLLFAPLPLTNNGQLKCAQFGNGISRKHTKYHFMHSDEWHFTFKLIINSASFRVEREKRKRHAAISYLHFFMLILANSRTAIAKFRQQTAFMQISGAFVHVFQMKKTTTTTTNSHKNPQMIFQSYTPYF